MIIVPGAILKGKRRRKRKRHRTDDDTVSLHSIDSVASLDEPKRRRRSSLARMQSLTSLLSPIKPVKKAKQALQKSLSLRSLMSPSPSPGKVKDQIKPYKPQPSQPKRRDSTFWYETVESCTLNGKLLERQEAIYELFRNEEDLIDDLKMVKSTYEDSMRKLRLLTDPELTQIFGQISTLVPLHDELVERLRNQRQRDGTTQSIGAVLLDWVPRLEEYVPYCANQVYAKALLDDKKQDAAVDDFLQRCQDSPFARRLPLASFLDIPRSRLVKYPLLLRNIQKLTPEGHEDIALLESAIAVVEKVIERVDSETGRAKCMFTREKLEFLDDKHRDPLIEESEVILCDGVLKNSRGTKMHVFLFEHVLVLSRVVTRGARAVYQVYRQPLPLATMRLHVLPNGQTSKTGSFRSAFSSTAHNRNVFRVSSGERGGKGSCHTLQANDEDDKKQWISSLRSVLAPENINESSSSDDEKDLNKSKSKAERRTSKRLSTTSMMSVTSFAEEDEEEEEKENNTSRVGDSDSTSSSDAVSCSSSRH